MKKSFKCKKVFLSFIFFLILPFCAANAQGIDPEILSGAEEGDAAAQYNAGLYYNRHKNYTFALQWFQKSSEQGYAPAQNALGSLYYHGRGTPRDYKKAFELYMKAAEQGEAEAEFNIAVMYDKGYGVPQDNAKAFEFFQKAAQKGIAEAQFNLATMYDTGAGAPKDLKIAFEWYKKAADQGYMTAQYNLGIMYSRGEGVSKDVHEAAGWFKKAAIQGDKTARSSLGALYFNGEFTGGRDMIRGCAWIYISENIDNIQVCNQALKKEEKAKALLLAEELKRELNTK